MAIRKQPEVENGEVAAVRIGEEATLKRVFRHENMLELRAENPSFPSIILVAADKGAAESAAQPVMVAAAAPSAADELMKFKQLLDAGAITQEEFDAKKKQLLGL